MRLPLWKRCRMYGVLSNEPSAFSIVAVQSSLREIVGDLDAARAPREFGEARRLHDVIAFALAEVDQAAPIRDGIARRLRGRQSTACGGSGRGSSTHVLAATPARKRSNVRCPVRRATAFERVVVEEREREFLFEIGLGRRRHLDAVVPRRIEHQLLLGNVEQIEEFEVAVEHVDLFFAPVLVPHEEPVFGEDDVLRCTHPRVREPRRRTAAGEPGQFAAVIARFIRDHDCDGRGSLPRRVREHRGERARNAVVAADALDADLTIRLGHRANEPHAARHAVEFGGRKTVVGEDQVRTDDAGNLLLEAILPRQLHDLLGLAVIEIVGDERRRRSARAAVVEAVERPVKGEQVVAEGFDLRQLRCGQCERFGADAPGDTFALVVDSEESGRYRFVQVQRLLASREVGFGSRTRHREKTVS